MFCPKCGFENQDDMRFCQQCGTPLAPAQPEQPMQHAPEQPAHHGPELSMSSQDAIQEENRNAVRGSMHRCCASLWVLLTALTFSLMILIQIIITVTSGGISGQINSIINQYGSSTYLNLYSLRAELQPYSTALLAITLIGMIPNILIALGLWQVYFAANSRTEGHMRTSGLTLIKVILIIKIVLLGLTIIGSEGAIVAAVILLNASYGKIAVQMLAVIVLLGIMIALIYAVVILYDALFLKSVSGVKKALRTGEANNRVSVAAAVLSFILAGCYLVCLLYVFSMGNVLSILQMIVSILCFLLIGILLLYTRGAMKRR